MPDAHDHLQRLVAALLDGVGTLLGHLWMRSILPDVNPLTKP